MSVRLHGKTLVIHDKIVPLDTIFKKAERLDGSFSFTAEENKHFIFPTSFHDNDILVLDRHGMTFTNAVTTDVLRMTNMELRNECKHCHELVLPEKNPLPGSGLTIGDNNQLIWL